MLVSTPPPLWLVLMSYHCEASPDVADAGSRMVLRSWMAIAASGAADDASKFVGWAASDSGATNAVAEEAGSRISLVSVNDEVVSAEVKRRTSDADVVSSANACRKM